MSGTSNFSEKAHACAKGLAHIARHITGCQLTQETRMQSAWVDRAWRIVLAASQGALSRMRRGCTARWKMWRAVSDRPDMGCHVTQEARGDGTWDDVCLAACAAAPAPGPTCVDLPDAAGPTMAARSGFLPYSRTSTSHRGRPKPHTVDIGTIRGSTLAMDSFNQGLTRLQFPASREHFLWDALGAC
jgi:hypothetical protein